MNTSDGGGRGFFPMKQVRPWLSEYGLMAALIAVVACVGKEVSEAFQGVGDEMPSANG